MGNSQSGYSKRKMHRTVKATPAAAEFASSDALESPSGNQSLERSTTVDSSLSDSYVDGNRGVESSKGTRKGGEEINVPESSADSDTMQEASKPKPKPKTKAKKTWKKTAEHEIALESINKDRQPARSEFVGTQFVVISLT